MKLKKIIKRNYKSIVKRGLISSTYKEYGFIEKLNEEVEELKQAIFDKNKDNRNEELADVILVCLNFAKHFNIDIEKELIDKIKINFKR